MKACVIGQHCTIGAKAKLNGCVIMDHVTIGDGCVVPVHCACFHNICAVVARVLFTLLFRRCVLQGAVVCHGVKIGAKSSIKNSQIGPSCVVEPQSALVPCALCVCRLGDCCPLICVACPRCSLATGHLVNEQITNMSFLDDTA